MQTVTLKFDVSGQNLIAGDLTRYASNTVNYVKAVFDLDGNWNSFDSVRAVWSTDFECISTVLDSEGVCYVPQEVLKRTGNVMVNLVGSIAENDELTDRLTTYPVVALVINANAKVCGTETAEVTPSQFEQFVHTVIDEVAKIKDIESVELNDDYTLTIRFSDDTETTVGPIRGEKGDTGPTGNGIAGIVKTSTTDLVDTYTITYTNGQTTTFNVTNGAKGDTGATGNGIATIAKTSTSGLVDTYTITFTDGTSTTFEVTNGQDGEVTYDELSELLPTETASGDIASFNDGQAVIPAVSVVATITPIQSGSGTPSPSNVRPISGHDEVGVSVVGKNLFNVTATTQTVNGITFTVHDDGTVTVNGTATDQANLFLNANGANLVNGTSYIINGCPTGGSINTYGLWAKNDGVADYGNGETFTYDGAAIVGRIRIASGTVCNNLLFKPMVRIATESDATFAPYNGQTYTDTLPTTVYGGTLDLVSGRLVVTHIAKDIGSMDFQNYKTGGFRTVDNLNPLPINSTCAIDDPILIVSMYRTYPASATLQSGQASIAGNSLYLVNADYPTDISAFKQAMNGQLVVYKLATPLTYQLTPQQIDTLKGQNNITATSGQVSVTYKADIQKYIDNAIATFA